jgi:hypothetical protein
MSTAKIVMLSSLAAAVSLMIFFRGDLQRYTKMKLM